ncbi:MAG: DUF2760 domain-containing protein [Deltaproteobacteria bacterium]|nr:DUF2760 domain-containing protein [Deltaproteobacteria bacterium]
MHPILALRAFFAALFGRPLPKEVIPAGLLPAPAPEAPALDTAPTKLPEPAPVPEPVPEPVKAPEPAPNLDGAAAQTLGVLQAGGRLLDFLAEEIESYDDADIGAAVREVHRGCKKALADHFDLAPVRTEDEEAMVTVAAGFNPAEVRLVGNVVGQPPFSGTLKHKGWKATTVRLPKVPAGEDGLVIAPAEVEV